MRAIGYLLLIAAAIYVVAIIYAMLTGSALPTAAPIQSSPLATLAAEWEPLFHLLLIVLAMLGAAASWLSLIAFGGIAAQRRDELLLGRFLRRWGVLSGNCACRSFRSARSGPAFQERTISTGRASRV